MSASVGGLGWSGGPLGVPVGGRGLGVGVDGVPGGSLGSVLVGGGGTGGVLVAGGIEGFRRSATPGVGPALTELDGRPSTEPLVSGGCPG